MKRKPWGLQRHSFRGYHFNLEQTPVSWNNFLFLTTASTAAAETINLDLRTYTFKTRETMNLLAKSLDGEKPNFQLFLKVVI